MFETLQQQVIGVGHGGRDFGKLKNEVPSAGAGEVSDWDPRGTGRSC